MHDKSGIDPKTELLATAARQAKSAIAIVSAEGSIEWVNECFEDMTGYSNDEVTGKENTDIFEELTVEDGAVLFSEQPAPAGAETITQEVYCKRKGGSYFCAEISFKPVFDEQDKLMMYVAVGTEITEKKKVLERLQQEHNLNNQILQSLEEGYLLVDEDANIHDVNTAYCRMVGYPKEELLSMSLHEVRPGMSPEYQQQFIERIKAEGSIEFETQHRTKDGQMIDLNASAAAIKRDGKVYLAGFVRDVTESKKAAQQLREQVEFNKKLIQTTKEGYILSDDKGVIQDVNASYCKMVGYAREELTGMQIGHIEEKFNEREIAEIIEEANRKGYLHFETIHRAKDGTRIDLEVSMTAIEVKDQRLRASFVRDVSKRKNIMRRLEKNEQEFKSLYDNNPNPVFQLDTEGFFIRANKAFVNTSGYSEEKLKQLRFSTLIAPEDLENVKERFANALQGNAQEHELKAVTRDGMTLQFQINSFPITIGGEVAGVFSIAEDITERKRAQNKLKKSEQNWQRLAENNPQPVQVTKEGIILFINEAGAELYGAESPEELLGRSVFSFNPPDVQKRIKKRIARMENDLPVDNYHEHSIIDLNGKQRFLKVHSTPINYQGQQAVQTAYHDITERKLAEKKLKQSEQRWHRLVERNPKAVQVTVDATIVFINKAGVKLYDAESMDELIGLSVFEFSHPDDLEKITERKHKLENDLPVDKIHENRIITLAGNERYIEVHSVPITYKGEDAIQTVIYDVTDRKQREQLIQQSLKEKEVLLQEIHHRVKNNMAVVSGLLQLQAMNTDNEEVGSILKESEMRILSMAMIHEKLYASESLSEINFEEYIKELSQTIIDSNQKNHKDISIKYNLEEVYLDINTAIPCGLILNELIVNCFKHAFKNRDKGSVLVGLTQKENRLCIFVEDNGCGLPEDFEIKSQDSLGMTLVKTLTRQLGGELTITEGEGSLGSCFMLVINNDTEK